MIDYFITHSVGHWGESCGRSSICWCVSIYIFHHVGLPPLPRPLSILYLRFSVPSSTWGGMRATCSNCARSRVFFKKIAAFYAYRGWFSIFVHPIRPKGPLFSSVVHASLPSYECLRHWVVTWRTGLFFLSCTRIYHPWCPYSFVESGGGQFWQCGRIWTISKLWALLIPLWRIKNVFRFPFSAAPQDFAHFGVIESVAFWCWAVKIRARLAGGAVLFVSTSLFQFFVFRLILQAVASFAAISARSFLI